MGRCRRAIIYGFMFLCVQVHTVSWSMHGISSVPPQVIQPNLLLSLCKNISFKKFAFIPVSFLAAPWSLMKGFVCHHPKKVVGGLLAVGAVWSGFHYFFAMQNRTNNMLDNHEKRVDQDMQVFGKLQREARYMREHNRALRTAMNNKFDTVMDGIVRADASVDTLHSNIGMKLETLDGHAQKLAGKEGMRLLGNEINLLVADVARALASESRAHAHSGEYED